MYSSLITELYEILLYHLLSYKHYDCYPIYYTYLKRMNNLYYIIKTYKKKERELFLVFYKVVIFAIITF